MARANSFARAISKLYFYRPGANVAGMFGARELALNFTPPRHKLRINLRIRYTNPPPTQFRYEGAPPVARPNSVGVDRGVPFYVASFYRPVLFTDGP